MGAHDAVIIVDHEGRPIRPSCPVCGLVVDPSGQARLRNSRWVRPTQKRIVIHLDRDRRRSRDIPDSETPESA
jgi:hypothetical protein